MLCITLDCMALQFIPLPAVMNMVVGGENRNWATTGVGGWVRCLGLASKSNRALQKVALCNQNKNSFCNQWLARRGLQSHKHQSQTNNHAYQRQTQILFEFMACKHQRERIDVSPVQLSLHI